MEPELHVKPPRWPNALRGTFRSLYSKGKPTETFHHKNTHTRQGNTGLTSSAPNLFTHPGLQKSKQSALFREFLLSPLLRGNGNSFSSSIHLP